MLDDWTITTNFDGDYCLECGGKIENCTDECPILQIMAAHLEKESMGG